MSPLNRTPAAPDEHDCREEHNHGGEHTHDYGPHRDHNHDHMPPLGAAPDRRLIVSLVLNLGITLLQVVGGIIANSLGLLSDAAHNLSDVVALGLSLWAVRLGRRRSTPTRTYAFKRAEILVALFNSAVLVAISIYLVVESIRRLLNPEPVQGLWVIGFAAGGLVINGLAALLLHSYGRRDLNLRSTFLHLVGDAATSFGVMLSGLLVYLTGWNYADPLVSILVSIWISRQAVRIIRSTVNILMEGTPEGIEFERVEAAIRSIKGVEGVHDLHIWAISSADLALSAHIEMDEGHMSGATRLLIAIKEMLARDFGIGHVTLELEPAGGECAGSTCLLVPKIVETNARRTAHLGHNH